MPIILWIFIAVFPWLNFIPESSILVGLVYRSEKGLVKRVMDKLEKYIEYIEKAEKLRLISRI